MVSGLRHSHHSLKTLSLKTRVLVVFSSTGLSTHWVKDIPPLRCRWEHVRQVVVLADFQLAGRASHGRGRGWGRRPGGPALQGQRVPRTNSRNDARNRGGAFQEASGGGETGGAGAPLRRLRRTPTLPSACLALTEHLLACGRSVPATPCGASAARAPMDSARERWMLMSSTKVMCVLCRPARVPDSIVSRLASPLTARRVLMYRQARLHDQVETVRGRRKWGTEGLQMRPG